MDVDLLIVSEKYETFKDNAATMFRYATKPNAYLYVGPICST